MSLSSWESVCADPQSRESVQWWSTSAGIGTPARQFQGVVFVDLSARPWVTRKSISRYWPFDWFPEKQRSPLFFYADTETITQCSGSVKEERRENRFAGTGMRKIIHILGVFANILQIQKWAKKCNLWTVYYSLERQKFNCVHRLHFFAVFQANLLNKDDILAISRGRFAEKKPIFDRKRCIGQDFKWVYGWPTSADTDSP